MMLMQCIKLAISYPELTWIVNKTMYIFSLPNKKLLTLETVMGYFIFSWYAVRSRKDDQDDHINE